MLRVTVVLAVGVQEMDAVSDEVAEAVVVSLCVIDVVARVVREMDALTVSVKLFVIDCVLLSENDEVTDDDFVKGLVCDDVTVALLVIDTDNVNDVDTETLLVKVILCDSVAEMV